MEQKNREYRSFAELRSEGSEEYKVEGYASTFEPYEMCEIDGEKYFERIEPTAFNDCDMSDVVLRVDHQGMVYARTSAGTLTVNMDDHGLHTEADLSRTANSRALYEEIKAGNYPQMSFCFIVPEGGDRFDQDSRTRVIERIAKLYDVSPVSFPANPTTELHARALEYFNGEIEKLKAERPEEPALEEVEERINEEGKTESAEELVETEEREAVETAETSTEQAEDRRAEEMAEYRALQNQVLSGRIGTVVETHEEINKMEEKKYTVDSAEYRDAFYAVLGDYATPEQRAIVVDTTNPGGGDAIAIPKTLDEKIWDGIHTAHPILADIATVRSGVAMEVTKHTAIATSTSKKLDSAATPAEESNTFVKVVLYGYDYEKYVTLTYAEAKMSQGALEDYLAEEISAELGEALAKDVFAQILADATTAQKVTIATSNPDYFAGVKSALALASLASEPVIYAPAAEYYEIVGAIKSGSPYNIATTLGAVCKKDPAATKVTIVDPKAFVLNEVQGIMVESDRDIKAHKVVVSGYLRAQGTLRKNKAAAYLSTN